MFDEFMEDEYMDDADGDVTPASSSLPPPRDNPELFGHDAIEKSLIDLYNKGTLPHALIFAGPMGIGKATMAFRFARFLLKHGSADTDQGGLFGDAPPAPENMAIPVDDPVFRKVASGGHPDLRYMERPVNDKTGEKKTVLDVDTIRTIPPFLRMKSSDGGWRIVIVDEADLMNKNAQNAILKILEEPPPQSMLILICDRLGAMIPTIRSRCRTIHFSPLNENAMSVLIKRAAPNATSGETALLALLSDGSMGRALTLHEEGGANTLGIILGFLENWPTWDWAKIHPMAENLGRGDEKAYAGFASIMEWVCAEILRAMAMPGRKLPEILNVDAVRALQNHYSLEEWTEICEKLREHFITINISNLDKRQGVIGAFAIIGGGAA